MLKTIGLKRPFEDTVLFSLGVVSSGRMLHTAGITARDESGAILHPGDMAGQVRQCFDTLDQILSAGGATWNDVVKFMLFATDVDKFNTPEIRKIREPYFVAKPACTLIEVPRLMLPDMMVEMEVIACID